MRNYAAFLPSVLMVPFSRGNVHSHTIPENTRFESDGKRPAVMLFSKSVHPLLLIVCAGKERRLRRQWMCRIAAKALRGDGRAWAVRCTHELTIVLFQSKRMSLKYARFARES